MGGGGGCEEMVGVVGSHGRVREGGRKDGKEECELELN